MFITGAHVYGKGAIVVVPKGERELFLTQNKNFSGETVTYEGEESLREVINRVLHQKSEHVLSYKKKALSELSPISSYTPSIGDDSLQEEPFEVFFRKHKLFVGDHNDSPFHVYETFLANLRSVFLSIWLNRDDPWKHVLPSSHIDVILSFYTFIHHNLLETTAYVDERAKQDLQRWLVSNETFLNMFRLELALRQEKKSLFYNRSDLKSVVRDRSSLTLERLRGELEELSESDMRRLERTARIGEELYVPGYMWAFSSRDPHYFAALVHGSKLRERQKIAFQLLSLFKFYRTERALDENFVRAMHAALEQASSLKPEDAAFQKYVREQFWENAREDDSPEGEKVLALLHHPDLRLLFPPLLFPEATEEGPLDFPTLIKFMPGYDWLSGQDQQNHLIQLVPFLQTPLQQVEVHSLKEAHTLSQTFMWQVTDFSTTPLYLVHFSGDLLEAYLTQNRPSRELLPYEKGLLISTLSRLVVPVFRDRKASKALSSQESTKAAEEQPSVRKQIISGLLAEAEEEDEEESGSPIKSDLDTAVSEMTSLAPVFDNPLSPQNVYALLLKPGTNLLALIRGGCFGGLRSVIAACGLEAEYTARYNDDDVSPWFLSSDSPFFSASFMTLIDELKHPST